MQSSELLSQRIETPIGPFHAAWSSNGLRSFEFFRLDRENDWAREGDLPSEAIVLQEAVLQYFETGRFDWDLDKLDWQDVSQFHQRVLRECYGIPPASTLTYGELAAAVGSPGAARAVGGAMARNRWPLLIPCHRVVGSSGKLTGYSGVGGVDTKRKLLVFENEASSAILLVG